MCTQNRLANPTLNKLSILRIKIFLLIIKTEKRSFYDEKNEANDVRNHKYPFYTNNP